LNKRVLQNNSKDDFFSKIKRGIKKWRLEILSSPTILKGILSLKTQNFAVK